MDLIEQPLWRVIIVNFPTAHKELKASPRKPNVDTESKSVKSANFEVWCLAAEKGEKIKKHYFLYYKFLIFLSDKKHLLRLSKSTSLTPDPLSVTMMALDPWSTSFISTFVAPASKEFSRSSFRAMAGLKIT